MPLRLTSMQYKNSLRFFFLLFLLCFSNFGGLTSLVTSFYSIGIQYLLMLGWFVVFILFILLFSENRQKFAKILKNQKLGLFFFIIFFVVVIETTNSFVLGGRSWIEDIVKQSFYFYFLPIVYPLVFLFSELQKNDLDFFKKSTLFFTISLCVLAILQVLSIYLKGPLFIVTSYTIRNGRPRVLYPSDLNFPVLYFCFSNLLTKGAKRKWLYALTLFLIIFCDFFILQGRASLLMNAFLMFFAIIFKITKTKNWNWPLIIKIFGVSFVSMIFLVGFFCKDNFVLAFSLVSGDLSLQARIESVRYFFGNFLDKPFFGFGFIKDLTRSSNDHFIYHGYSGSWVRIDVGLIGFLDAFGLLALVLYSNVIGFLIGSYKKIDEENERLLCLIFQIEIIISSLSLCIFDYQRFLTMCVLCSLVFSFSVNNVQQPKRIAISI